MVKIGQALNLSPSFNIDNCSKNVQDHSVKELTISDSLLNINANLNIPLGEFSFHFSRSSGPGGQHVNRTESRVELRFDVNESPSLNARQKQTLLQKLKTYLDNDGVVHLFVDTHRSQFQNKQVSLERFQSLLQEALKPEKKRTPTKPSRSSKEKRLKQKKERSRKKEQRKKPDW